MTTSTYPPLTQLSVENFQSLVKVDIPLAGFTVIVGPSNSGKALDCDTDLLTTEGWKNFASVVPGDAVFHPSGDPVKVVEVSDVMTGRPCFEVTLTDGRSVVADADHQWSVLDRRSESPRYKVFTTQQLFAEGLQFSGSVSKGKFYPKWRFSVPPQEAVQTHEVLLPLDPYLFGAWLGDGGSKKNSLTCSEEDLPHWIQAIEVAGFLVSVHRKPETTNYSVGAVFKGLGKQTYSITSILKKMGVWGAKYVPDEYLSSSPLQREALLQGLMDTDGTICKKRGRVEFTSTNKLLADAVLYLARSLGWTATSSEGRATLYGKDCGPKYRVCFRPSQADPYTPFRLQRKVDLLRHRMRSFGLAIASIQEVPSRPVRCIQVDSEDGLFLAGRGLIPTHNSALLRALRAVVRNVNSPSAVRVGKTLFTSAVRFNDTTVSIERGKSSSTYRVLLPDGSEEVYTKAGRTVPEDVQKLLGIPDSSGPDLVFSSQIDPPFLLNETGSGAAKVLGDLTNISKLHAAAREANRRRLEASKLQKIREADAQSCVERMQAEFSDLPATKAVLTAAREDLDRVAQAAQRRETLMSLLNDFNVAEAALADLTQRLSELPQPADIESLSESAGELLGRRHMLLDSLDSLARLSQAYDQLITVCASSEKESEQAQVEYSQALVRAGTCPTCGASTAQHAESA